MLFNIFTLMRPSVDRAVRFDDLRDAEMKRRRRGAKPPTMKIPGAFAEFSADIRILRMSADQRMSLARNIVVFRVTYKIRAAVRQIYRALMRLRSAYV